MVREEAPAEIPGLRAAFAAERAAEAKRDGIVQRLKQSQADQVLRKRDRRALVDRAAAGEVVSGAELRAVEDAIRDAEASEVLLTEALKRAEDDLKNAASASGAITAVEWQRKQAQLQREYEAAQAALTAAQAEVNRTYERTRNTPNDVIAAMRALFDVHR